MEQKNSKFLILNGGSLSFGLYLFAYFCKLETSDNNNQTQTIYSLSGQTWCLLINHNLGHFRFSQ